jgi:hypothetical protein
VLKRLVGPETEVFLVSLARSSGLPITARQLRTMAENFIRVNQDLAASGLPALFDPRA